MLKVTSPTGETRTHALDGVELQIGSSIEATLVLAGHGVSARHCRVERRGPQLFVVDRGSRNGTFVNSVRCTEPTELKVGDRIGVGAYVLELTHGRKQIEHKAVAGKLRAEGVKLSRDDEERRASERARLTRYASEWQAQGRPRRLLLDARDLAVAYAWPEQERSSEPTLAELLRASMRARLIRLAVMMVCGGAVIAAVLISWIGSISKPPPRPPTATPTAGADTDEGPPVVSDPGPEQAPSESGSRERIIEHTIQPEETYDDIIHYYGISLAMLQQFNTVALGEDPVPGTVLRIFTARPRRPPLIEERYIVAPGDDWTSIAGYYGVRAEALRRRNPKFGDQLRGGEELSILIENEPFAAVSPNPDDLPIFIVPDGASSEGKVTGGALRNAVQLLPSPLAQVRCSIHAYATNYTVAALMRGIAEFRQQGYKGEIMIGDLSRREGGQYGPHKSHQSGRDADIWLLAKTAYKRTCRNCSTDACRPEPEDVDWAAQWRFILALDNGGMVQEIFLSTELQENLHAAGVAQGAHPDELRRLIQWPRRPGFPALVMHSDGHVHHIHVRFKCDPEDLACSKQK